LYHTIIIKFARKYLAIKYLKILLALVLFSVETQAQNIKDFSLTSVTDKYCIRHTSEYFEKASTLSNVIQVFIKPDSEQEINAWANKLKSTNSLPIYQDLNGKLADQFNIPNGYQFHGQVVHYPALILLNDKGEEVFRYIGKNNADRFSFEQLKAKINELKVL